jgi:hypothetical protein
MAFFRFSRDKRGYEHFYLVQPTANRRGKVRSRVLYWFRTPPGIRVGREPFDEGVRRALEAQNPDITFDWPTILEAPIPSADADKWRDRRRAERAARQTTPSSDAELENEPTESGDADAVAPQPSLASDDEPIDTREEATTREIAAAPNPTAPAGPDAARKRRRRRRGRRVGVAAQPGQPTQPDDAAEPTEPDGPGDPTGD